VRWSLASAFVVSACGAPDIPAFRCEVDEQCTFGSEFGVCTREEYCAFADDSCKAGFRYGEHAATHLRGTCTER
jgi:hypothetical protein